MTAKTNNKSSFIFSDASTSGLKPLNSRYEYTDPTASAAPNFDKVVNIE